VVTVDRARISPGDAVAHRADSAELFDVEMGELARMLAAVSPSQNGVVIERGCAASAGLASRASETGVSPATISRVLRRLGLKPAQCLGASRTDTAL